MAYVPVEHLRIYGDEEDCVPVHIDPDMKADNGWLSPDGILYECRYEDHNALQFTLERTDGIADLELAGWIKLMTTSLTTDHWQWDFLTHEATQAQVNAMWDWHRRRGITKFPVYLEEYLGLGADRPVSLVVPGGLVNPKKGKVPIQSPRPHFEGEAFAAEVDRATEVFRDHDEEMGGEDTGRCSHD
jgi:hypothetical protein